MNGPHEAEATPFWKVLFQELAQIIQRRTRVSAGDASLSGLKQREQDLDAKVTETQNLAQAKEQDREKAPEQEQEKLKRELRKALEECQTAREEAARSARAEAQSMELAGLAFSGGGIRSATFNLGVLQALAGLDLLKRFDYLSTVSGGGYIGSWLAAWIKREGGITNVEKQLRPERTSQAAGRVTLDGAAKNARDAAEEEPESIFHLRSYSNYLSPKLGFFSTDGWALAAIVLRNLLLNWLVLLPVVAAVLMLPRLVVALFHGYDWNLTEDAPTATTTNYYWPPIVLALALLWAAWGRLGNWRWRIAVVVFGGLALLKVLASVLKESRFQTLEGYLPEITVAVALLNVFYFIGHFLKRIQRVRAGGSGPATPIQERLLEFHGFVLLPLLVAAVVGCYLLVSGAPHPFLWDWVRQPLEKTWVANWQWVQAVLCRPSEDQPTQLERAVAFALFFALARGTIYLATFLWNRTRRARKSGGAQDESRKSARWDWGGFAAAVVAAAVGGAVLSVPVRLMQDALNAAVAKGYDEELVSLVPAHVASFGPPALLLVFCLVAACEAGLLGTKLDESSREWWSSLGGWVFIYLTLWVATFVAGLYGAMLLTWAWEAGGIWLNTAITSGWLLTTLGGVLAGKASQTGNGKRNRVLELVARVAPHVFIAGLLAAVSFVIGLCLNGGETENVQGLYWAGGTTAAAWYQLVFWSVLLLALAFLVALRIDVNVFSLHGLYGNRLIRCYLGASRPKVETRTDQLHGVPTNSVGPARAPNALTGFDPNDDFPLQELRIGKSPAQNKDTPIEYRWQPYWGPYLLVNTAMNLVQGDELAWQERKAESFVLSPLYCGSKSTGYRALPEYAENLSLGKAVTLSGAAASPNMGYHSSAPVTALMTVFNVRLGGWIGNPKEGCWRREGPRIGLFYLWKELFGRSNRRSNYVYLSDGGHFENLGVYELVRRRCRYIVVCDAEQDEGLHCGALAGLIQKCQADFGVRIEINTDQICKPPKDGCKRWHCAIGKVRYDDVDPSAVAGTLVYLKASLTGDEPPDVRNYAAMHPEFPHQTTGDQFFDESQFESYRRLGIHIAQEVFGDAAQQAHSEALDQVSAETQRKVTRELFSALSRRWFPPPPEAEANYLESVEACIELERAFRSDENLVRFCGELYPETQLQITPNPLPSNDLMCKAELQALLEMLQVMENAWLGLDLDRYHAHPLYRGWMNAFRRWTNTATFRRGWRLLRGEFSLGFVRFCESELKVTAGYPRAYPVDPTHPNARLALDSLAKEFAWEWPSESSLIWLLQESWKLGLPVRRPFVWLLGLSDIETVTSWQADQYACGLAVAWKVSDDDVELLVWLRGAYRTLGIGRHALDRHPRNEGVLDQLFAGLRYQNSKAKHLIVRFPQDELAGTGNRMVKAAWLTFFHKYGFHKRLAVDHKYLILERRL